MINEQALSLLALQGAILLQRKVYGSANSKAYLSMTMIILSNYFSDANIGTIYLVPQIRIGLPNGIQANNNSLA